MNDAAAAIWGSRISYYTAGQGFYAGESGWAGAPGETMNAELLSVGVLILPLAGGGAWRRWVVMRVVATPTVSYRQPGGLVRAVRRRVF